MAHQESSEDGSPVRPRRNGPPFGPPGWIWSDPVKMDHQMDHQDNHLCWPQKIVPRLGPLGLDRRLDHQEWTTDWTTSPQDMDHQQGSWRWPTVQNQPHFWNKWFGHKTRTQWSSSTDSKQETAKKNTGSADRRTVHKYRNLFYRNLSGNGTSLAANLFSNSRQLGTWSTRTITLPRKQEKDSAA